MCTALFTIFLHCACPPTPVYPYVRLCAKATQHHPVRACAVGGRMSQTAWARGRCAWCVGCQGEALRGERSERVRRGDRER